MSGGETSARRLTLRAIFDSKTFEERTIQQPEWMKDGIRVSYLDRFPGTRRKTVWVCDTDSVARNPLIDPRRLRNKGAKSLKEIYAYQWSPDECSLLIPDRAPARFQPCGNLSLLDVRTKRLQPLTRTDLPQRHPKFSPDGLFIGLVRGENLWVVNLADGTERQLTFDGGEAIYNGRFGWVYEEELGLADGWAWSPDSRRIAFFQQDETAVPEVLLPQYDDLHQAPLRTRYPKPGDPNPSTRIGVVDLGDGRIRWIQTDAGLEGEECYVSRMQWTLDGAALLIQRMPRSQKRVDVLLANPITGEATMLFHEEDAAWVDVQGDVTFAGGSDRFLWISDRSGWRHIYEYELGGQCVGQVTDGEWDVDEICGVDADARVVFFTAARHTPFARDLYRVGLEGGDLRPVIRESERWNRALFSKDRRRFVHTYSDLATPPQARACAADGRSLAYLACDSIPRLCEFDLPKWRFLTFRASDGIELNARILEPQDLDPSRRHPALIYTYGGPGSQAVTNAWPGSRSLWFQFLVQQGYVVFVVDNRGTCGRGREFKKQVAGRLGELETVDQIEGAKYLAGLPYVDPKRIGIFGWSYGGYMASLCMLRGAEEFRAGIAVAPVTDWALYDSIYTERYMGTPDANPEGYERTAPVREAGKLRGRFMLIHGLLDDNVHFQNAARLATALQDTKRPFETMFYPGKRHGIEDRHYHLYRLMTEFLRRNL